MLSLDLLPSDLSWLALAALLVASFAAGWVDAVVGGGGLIQLPALLLVGGMTPLQALGTNKLASVFGTLTSATTYVRRARPAVRTALPMAAGAFVLAFAGASVASRLPAEVIQPVIVLALVAVTVVTAAKPSLGDLARNRRAAGSHYLLAMVLAVGIGFYDGVLGPGTGTFLVIGMIALLGYDFLHASATAKIVNVATNLGALVFFLPAGAAVLGLGVLLGAANVAGAHLGARMAIAKGNRFIRVVFLVVATALIVRLGVDVVGDLIG
ncbi:MAG: putative rane transporter protein [Klenkia sp.]|nr:putative rane transporter protein [Klenkia sp.]